MKKLYLYILLIITLNSNISCQENKTSQQHIAICEENNGCEFAKLNLKDLKVDELLQKNNFWTKASPDATLIIIKCQSQIDNDRSLEEIHHAYGGTPPIQVKEKYDFVKYIESQNCFRKIEKSCPNKTKKITFSFVGEESSGTSFFYLNIQKDESYMPDEAFVMMGIPSTDAEGRKVSINQFIKRKGYIDNYVITAGKKVHTTLDMTSTINQSQDQLNYQRFLKDFKKTGKIRKFQNNDDVEFVGKDEDGKSVTIWLSKSTDVCLPANNFDRVGFYNLGYFLNEGETFLITELSGSNFQLKIGSVEDAEYSFDSTGYTSY